MHYHTTLNQQVATFPKLTTTCCFVDEYEWYNETMKLTVGNDNNYVASFHALLEVVY
jgi:hypothetical protein